MHNFWDRGLLGLALAPNFPTNPYVYVLYTYDGELGSPAPAPRWGTPGAYSDPCPTPPGPTADGCVVSGRLSRLQAAGNVMTGSEQVLIHDWCQQYPSHSIGDLDFGPDGALYVSGGDGASFNFVDCGQDGTPVNPCGDPLGRHAPADRRGRRPAQPGPAHARRPHEPRRRAAARRPHHRRRAARQPARRQRRPNARRIVAYGLRNPFRFTFRPGTSEVWIGDVGWDTWEEINRSHPTGRHVTNFGWPCYEGSNCSARRAATTQPT